MHHVKPTRYMETVEVQLDETFSLSCNVLNSSNNKCWTAGEPNNDSPLNTQAAKLWDNQEEYKRVLQKKYADAQKN